MSTPGDRQTGTTGSVELLAKLMATVGDNLGADDFQALDGGVACTLYLESGDRYRVIVQWVGDNE